METPTITDWVQAITSVLALSLALASLIWQWRTQAASHAVHLRIEVTEEAFNVWSARLIFSQAPTDHALKVEVRAVRPRGVKLFDPTDLPYRPSSGDVLLVLMPRQDWQRYVDVRTDEAITLGVVHGSEPPAGADATVGLGVPADTASVRLRVRLLAPHRRRPLISKTRLISPSR